jgi:hypothetical protein
MSTKRDQFKMLNILQNIILNGNNEIEFDYKEEIHEIFWESINNKRSKVITSTNKLKNGIQLMLFSPTKHENNNNNIRKQMNNNLSHSNNESSFEEMNKISIDFDQSNKTTNTYKMKLNARKAFNLNRKNWINSILSSCHNQCSL